VVFDATGNAEALIKGESSGFMQKFERNGQIFLHSPVHMNPEYPNVFTAIIPRKQARHLPQVR
jgi:hypothetical protein